jgi:hypothetical protein
MLLLADTTAESETSVKFDDTILAHFLVVVGFF